MKRNLLLSLLAISGAAFASQQIDMTNLKCGSFQIYNSTTVQQIRDNCKVIKEGTMKRVDERNLPEKYWQGQDSMFELHFTGSNQAESVVRCDFLNNNPTSKVVGCR